MYIRTNQNEANTILKIKVFFRFPETLTHKKGLMLHMIFHKCLIPINAMPKFIMEPFIEVHLRVNFSACKIYTKIAKGSINKTSKFLV